MSGKPKISSRDVFYGDYDNIIRWSSYHCQIALVRSVKPKRILEVGIGNKTVSNYLRQQGFDVTTCDLEPGLGPDRIGDIRNLPFEDASYDLVMSCEVLEHLPWEDFSKALEQMHRVSFKYVLISIPRLSIYFEMAIRTPLVRAIVKQPFVDMCCMIPYPFKKCSPSHYWEMGMKGYSPRKIRDALRQYFDIFHENRPLLHPKQHFFVMEKKIQT